MTHLQFLEKFGRTTERKPQLTLLAAFAAVIIIGGLLLFAPFSQNSDVPRLSIVDSFFISASATCVTGLTVTNVSAQFNAFGKLIILILIQIGGIGIMTFAAFFVMLAGRKMRADREMMVATSIGKSGCSLPSLLKSTMLFTFLIEGIGALLLTFRFASRGEPLLSALKHGIFHAASSFCNAGITLYSDNLVSLRSDTILMGITSIMIILGGLGFYVIESLGRYRPWRRDLSKRGRLSIHCRIVLWATLILIIAGTLQFAAQEWNNTLTGLSNCAKMKTALFQTISTRTAGFNLVDMQSTTVPTQFFSMLLMLIGGAPGSTAGGLKVTTLVILLATMFAIIRGRRRTIIYNREIPEAAIREAIAIFCLSAIIFSVVFGCLLITEARTISTLHTGHSCNSVRLVFETVSALATNGLSTNFTSSLSTAGRVLTIIAMYIGRLGPLTIALSVGRAKQEIDRIRYVEEGVIIG